MYLFHSPTLTIVATRKETITLTRESILKDITVTFSDRESHFKIRTVKKRNIAKPLPQTHTDLVWYATFIIPLVVLIAVLPILILILYIKLRRPKPIMKHISTP